MQGLRHAVGGLGGPGGSSSLPDRHIQHFSSADVLCRVSGGGLSELSSFCVVFDGSDTSAVEWSTRTGSEGVGELEDIEDDNEEMRA